MSTTDGERFKPQRRGFNINTLNRHVVKESFQLSSTTFSVTINGCCSELDSHADTSVDCMSCLIVHDYDKCVDVTGYNPRQGRFSAVLADEFPHTGEVCIIKYTKPSIFQL